MKRLLKLFSLLTLVVISIVLFQQAKVQKPDYINRRSDFKYILYWSRQWGEKNWDIGYGSEPFAACPVNNCFLTSHRYALIDLEDFDALLFHGADAVKMNPPRRRPDQVYIYNVMEAPPNIPFKFSEEFFYNWTMTYRKDSDVRISYGGFYAKKGTPSLKNDTNYKPPSALDISKRPFSVAWFVSNCRTSSKREQLYHKMAKHIDIHVFGDCNFRTHTCPKSTAKECNQMLQDKYKFYLSFENAICQDYVTEKLFRTLKYDIVPVVYGGVNYTEFAPPHSVIDVSHFNSVQDLINYLRFLIDHPEEYVKYFEWKKNYVIDEQYYSKGWCELCAKLNRPIVHKSYRNVYKWMAGDKNELCKNVNQLPKIVFN